MNSIKTSSPTCRHPWKFGVLILAASLTGTASSLAQIPITSANPVTENFNGIGATNTAALPANWKMTAAGAGLTATWSTAGNLTVVSQASSSGSPTAAGRYNWGNSVVTTDRAVGFMTSGSFASPNSIMAHYINNSGAIIEDLAISFDVERYRINSAAANVTFFTSSDGSTWTARTAGDTGAFATGTNSYTFTGGTVVSPNFTISGINIPIGQPVYLRWVFNTTGSNSQGLGLDNVSVTATLGSDSVNPLLAAVNPLSPADGALNVAIDANLSITFNEAVQPGGGDVILYQGANVVETFTVSVGNISGATATFNPTDPLTNSTNYHVIVQSNAFKDLANNAFDGLLLNTDWNFSTIAADTTNPVPTLFPADGNLTFVPTASLELSYNENVVLGTGVIQLYNAADELAGSFNVTGPEVTLSGNTLRIKPATPLAQATSYYVVVPQGVVKDLSNNLSDPIAGPDGWNFTTRGIPAVVISQYYEGTTSGDRYIELKNNTNGDIDLNAYRLTVWSDTSPSDNEGWKSGTGSTDRITSFAEGTTIPANGYFLVANTGAATPAYAANNNDFVVSGLSATSFNGDDSIVLYSGTGFTRDEIVDVFSVSGLQAENKSLYRANETFPGFDFDSGSSFLNYPTIWTESSLSSVNSATEGNPWYLTASVPMPKLTLVLGVPTVLENATPVSATLSRTLPYTGPLTVQLSSSNPSAATVPSSVVIPSGEGTVNFNITPLDNAYLQDDRAVTITASATSFIPDSKILTVQDNPEDVVFPVVINEVDSDTFGIDQAEFIELYNNSSESVSLDGAVLVLYNGGSGTSEASYLTINLASYTIPANGFFVVGNATVASVNLIIADESIQNGADAVALYYGEASAYPNNTLASTAPGFLVDAVVYGTADADATTLLAALTPGKIQVDEGTGTNAGTAVLNSIARVPDGGARFDSGVYVAQAPTPGATNNPPEPTNDYAAWIDSFFEGETDPLIIGFKADPDGDGKSNGLENYLGSPPNAFSPGLTMVGENEGTLTFQHTLAAVPADDVQGFYEWSVNLTDWYSSGALVEGVQVAISPSVPVEGMVTVMATVQQGTPSKLFVRLGATQVGPME